MRWIKDSARSATWYHLEETDLKIVTPHTVKQAKALEMPVNHYLLYKMMGKGIERIGVFETLRDAQHYATDILLPAPEEAPLQRDAKGQWDSMTAPIMPKQCPTCPFGPNGDPKTRQHVIDKLKLKEGGQICHHHELHGKSELYLCRGAFEEHCKLAHEWGLIDAPTIEAWEAKRDCYGFPQRKQKVEIDQTGQGFRTRQTMGVLTDNKIKRSGGVK